MQEPGRDLDKWKSQIRKGFLELCVLAALGGRREAYGLELMEVLSASGLEVGEGTLYPLLTRLTQDGSLEASWTTPERGHPRKYYRLSPRGRESLAAMGADYEASYAAYRAILAEGETP